MDLSNILDAIGGVFVAIYAIWTIGVKVLNEAGTLTKKGREARERRQKEEKEKHQALVTAVSDEVVLKMEPRFEKLDEKIDKMTISSNDLLRIKINDVYYRYNRYKKILRYDKENCSKMVQDYFAQDGNTYVHDLWDEICSWEVVLSWDEIEKREK